MNKFFQTYFNPNWYTSGLLLMDSPVTLQPHLDTKHHIQPGPCCAEVPVVRPSPSSRLGPRPPSWSTAFPGRHFSTYRQLACSSTKQFRHFCIYKITFHERKWLSLPNKLAMPTSELPHDGSGPKVGFRSKYSFCLLVLVLFPLQFGNLGNYISLFVA